MPLGFGRSILSKPIVAAAGGGAGYAFADNGAINSGNKATYIPYYASGPFANTTAFSIVIWFRIKSTTEVDSPGTRPFQVANNNGSNFFTWTIATSPNDSYVNMFTQSKNNLVFLKGNTTDPATWQAFCMDGAWHCLMASMDVADVTDTTKNNAFIDDTNVGSINGGNANKAAASFSETNYVNLRNNGATDNSIGYAASFESGEFFEFGPVWVYDSSTDFTSSANRAYYYNASNTDGFVDPGTDGESGGAPTPEVFLYHDGTNLLDGGPATLTDENIETQGTGSIRVISNTAGPGSGDTI